MRAARWLLLAIWCTSPASAQMIYTTNGTGFYVNRDGYLLTNAHVVQHCAAITISGAVNAEATLVAQNIGDDLALLRTDAIPTTSASFTANFPPEPGTPVVIIGYPGALGQHGKMTVSEATLSATHGPRGEAQWLQFSDASAQGNSGGPLLDASGHVLGVVVAKSTLSRYNESAAREDTIARSDLAISLPVVQRFLEANNVLIRTEESSIRLSADRVADMARDYVVHVGCRLE